MRSLFLFFFSTLFFFGAVFSAFAQSVGNDPLEIVVFPEFPAPGEVTTLTLSTFSFNLDSSDIVWSVGGKVALQGVGQKSLRVLMGAAGETMRVGVLVTTEDGARFDKSISLRPASVEIIVEPLTYTPPFYRGAPRLSSQARVRLTAVPHFVEGGREIAPGNLLYTWLDDGETIADLSGAGQQSAVLIAPIEGDVRSIGVVVESRDRAIAAQKYVDLAPEAPRVVLYEDHPTIGIRYNQAFTVGARVTDPETTFVVEPYFFSVSSRASPNLSYSWSADEREIVFEGGERGVLTLRQEGAAAGRVDIGLTLQNLAQIVQAAALNFLVLYGR